MTQIDLAATAQPTAFALLKESQAIPHELMQYRGVLTPRRLDAAGVESAAFVTGAGGHDLGWLKRVAVRGDDRFRWLSGMVTNMVNDLGTNAGAWNLVLNAQGRIQGDLNVWREGDQLELEIASDQMERLLAHFEHFIIMDDVELVPLGGLAAVGLTGPAVDAVLERLGLPILNEPMTSTRVEWNGIDLRLERLFGNVAQHYALWVTESQLSKLWKFVRTAGAIQVGAETLEAFRVAEGIPLYGVDMAERDLPQETSQMLALHFNKGCYLGQEIVERIRSRGNVHRHLRHLELDGPVPSAETNLMGDGETAAGQIRSVAALQLPSGTRVFALAMMRGEMEARTKPFTYTAGAVQGTARLLAAAPSFSA
ncbi:MAG: folate-binding protein [Terracidiphilus sp.]|jgi:folate-binding protein YgfZ